MPDDIHNEVVFAIDEKNFHGVHRGQTPKLVSFFASYGNISARLKMESAPDKKYSGHAHAFSHWKV